MKTQKLAKLVDAELRTFKPTFSKGLLDSILDDIRSTQKNGGELRCAHPWATEILNVIRKFSGPEYADHYLCSPNKCQYVIA